MIRGAIGGAGVRIVGSSASRCVPLGRHDQSAAAVSAARHILHARVTLEEDHKMMLQNQLTRRVAVLRQQPPDLSGRR